MINKKLNEILVCPDCMKGSLILAQDGKELYCQECNKRFPVREDIPVMLESEPKSGFQASEIHRQYGTSFNYIEHYQKDALVYDYFAERDGVTEHSDRRLRELVASQITKKSGLILDTGCGKAWVAEIFCKRGFEVVSMDISFENTSKALLRYPFENHSAIVADVWSLPFKDNCFDYIIASEIIEHVVSPSVFIKQLFRVLAPGGALIITTPYKEKLQYSLCIHCNRLTPHNAHLHSFDEFILKSLYSENDLQSFYWKTFNNKILAFLRLHVILKYLPFKLWAMIDNLMNSIYRAPLRILGKWEKII
jgi:2-polyprenyl-3-methyl-5-hydroxy-6-metoxy-1,4-benzoquinol methylase/uncharacterized protein YbaR (Trm112 family)